MAKSMRTTCGDQANHSLHGAHADHKQQATNNERQTTNNKQRTTTNNQQPSNNKQQTTHNKQQTANNKQHTTNNTHQTTNHHHANKHHDGYHMQSNLCFSKNTTPKPNLSCKGMPNFNCPQWPANFRTQQKLHL